MKKTVIFIAIAIIAFLTFLSKAKDIKSEILVLPVDLSKVGTFSGILECRHPCAMRFEIFLENPVEYSDELARQLEECDIWLELLVNGTVTRKKIDIFYVETKHSELITKLELYVDSHLMEGFSLGKHDVKFVVGRGVKCLGGVKQTLNVRRGCYGPESFEVFLYGSVCIICIIVVILSYPKYGEHFAQKQESDELTSK